MANLMYDAEAAIQPAKGAIKKKVLVDVWIECEAPGWVGKFCQDEESRAKELESWVCEFHDFIRDHRSQDPVHLYVQRKYEDQCSECGYEWETGIDEKTGELICLGCGAPVLTYKNEVK